MDAEHNDLTDRQLNRGKEGFTLVELLAVIGIITLLMGMILGLAGWAKQAAYRARAQANIQSLHEAVQEYKLENGDWPVDTDTFNAAASSASGIRKDEDGNPTDPWETPYVYVYSEPPTDGMPGTYSLRSSGPDKTENTADDIYSGK